MKFGLFGGPRSREGVEDGYRLGYMPYLDGVIEAEALGYHSNFLVEHHFSGMGQVSASLNILSWLAARTSTIRLGTAVVVVPWHNPVLIAEQAATVDLLSNGRFDFGVGKGYRPIEFHGFCIPMTEASDRFEEAMALIRKAWTTEGRFTHRGARWQFEDIVVEPACVQKPYPPLWLAAGQLESLRYAAANGYHLFLDQFATFEVIFRRLRIYRDALTAAGRAYDPMGVAVARALLVADDQTARERAIAARARALEVMNAFGRSQDGRTKSSMVSDDDLRKATEQGALIGPPDEIIARLKRMEAEGIEYVLLNASQEDLRVFAREVMPAVS